MGQLGVPASISQSGQIPNAPPFFFFFLPHFILAFSGSCDFNSFTVSPSSF